MRKGERIQLRVTPAKKRQIVRALLMRGLSVGQVTLQVNCGRDVVYRERNAMHVEALLTQDD